MSLDLDDETRETLGHPVAQWDLVVGQLTRVTARRIGRARKPNQVAWVIAPKVKRTPANIVKREATYQRGYADTEAGRERRRAASRAYRARRRNLSKPRHDAR